MDEFTYNLTTKCAAILILMYTHVQLKSIRYTIKDETLSRYDCKCSEKFLLLSFVSNLLIMFLLESFSSEQQWWSKPSKQKQKQTKKNSQALFLSFGDGIIPIIVFTKRRCETNKDGKCHVMAQSLPVTSMLPMAMCITFARMGTSIWVPDTYFKRTVLK